MGRQILMGWVCVLGCLGWAGGTTYYVDDSAVGANDGSSWTDAFVNLQVALDVAIQGDEIRVGQGTYRPTIVGGDRAISFILPNGVSLLGGYAGVGAEDPGRRDIAAYATILSGDLNGDDLPVNIASELLESPSRQDNSYHIVQVPYMNPPLPTKIGGFTITGGNANGEHYTQQDGGGIEANSNTVMIEDCVLTANSAAGSGGGCIWGDLRNCKFRLNYAVKYGGGVSFPRSMQSCVFEGNVSDMGGGMYGASGETVYTDCEFRDNKAAQGGAVYLGNQQGAFDRSGFVGNQSTGDGGAIYIMNNCTCLSNLTMFRCRLVGNRSGDRGGAIYHEGNPRAVLYSCLVQGNQADGLGGGIYSLTYEGMRDMGYLGVTNCTIVGNKANQTGGIWFCSATTEFLDVVNTILWGNGDLFGAGHLEGQIRISVGCGEDGTGGNLAPPTVGAPVPVRYCCIEGLTAGYGGEGNIGADPMFLPTMGPLPNYHVTAESPCINAGTNAAYPCMADQPNPGTGTWVDSGDPSCSAGMTDLDGLPRIRGGVVDMGAYEFQIPVGTILYVDDSAPGMKDGSSWGDAFTDLQDALAIAKSGQEIRVAQGTYRPADPNGNREASFELKNGVTIKGGFAGFGASDPDLRDAKIFQTILSGDLNQTLPVLTDDNFYPKLMDRGTGSYDNCLHVVAAIGVDASAVLDGVVITGGTANGWVYGESSEAKNYHGGGVYVESASPTLIDCTITGNIAFVYNGPAATGGGMYCRDGDPTLIRCSFVHNVADDYDSDAYGAGMCVENGGPKLIGCVFERNATLNWGGGLAKIGTGRLTLRNCVFDENSGQYGGGGLWDSGNGGGEMDGCVFSRNRTHIYGGGMCLNRESTPWRIQHCLVYGNKAEGSAGMYLCGADTQVINCTITDNEARDQWGGVMCHEGGARFVNCIFRGNTCDNDNVEWAQIGRNDGVARFDYCSVQGWTGQFPGVGTIDVDPLFVDSAAGDYHLKSQAGHWDAVVKAWVQDAVTSPCIDAGDPASPIMHEPFPNGGVINMGAYGGTDEASKSWFGGPVCDIIVAGDINGDCAVDLADFAILAGNWLWEKE